MEEKTVTNEQMTALKALAETNIQVSQAKESLFSLQNTETAYIKEREERAIEKIREAVSQSQELLSEVSQNYGKVKELSDCTSELAISLVEIHEIFQKLLLDFTEKNDAWEKNLNIQLQEISDLRQDIRSDQIRIENDKKGVNRAKKLISDEKLVIESRQAQMKTALDVIDRKSREDLINTK